MAKQPTNITGRSLSTAAMHQFISKQSTVQTQSSTKHVNKVAREALHRSYLYKVSSPHGHLHVIHREIHESIHLVWKLKFHSVQLCVECLAASTTQNTETLWSMSFQTQKPNIVSSADKSPLKGALIVQGQTGSSCCRHHFSHSRRAHGPERVRHVKQKSRHSCCRLLRTSEVSFSPS